MDETKCGILHPTIEDAINHACAGLVAGNKYLLPIPYWGTRGGNIANVGKVVGWQSMDRQKRWRLDYDPAKGVHVNEEDFAGAAGEPKKIVHLAIASETYAMTYWNKWTSRFDKPPHVLEAEKEIDRRRRQGFK